MITNTSLLNRDTNGNYVLPADGWFHLVPRGEHLHAPTELLQVLDETALAAMVRQFSQESQQPNFPGLLVDFDHFSYDPDKSSLAAGWIVAVENRPDGLWGRIRWTDEGEAALRHGRFRLISPAWLPRDCAAVPNYKPQTVGLKFSQAVRPLRLDTAGLTNNPNLKGMVPLSNHEVGRAVPSAPLLGVPTSAEHPSSPSPPRSGGEGWGEEERSYGLALVRQTPSKGTPLPGPLPSEGRGNRTPAASCTLVSGRGSELTTHLAHDQNLPDDLGPSGSANQDEAAGGGPLTNQRKETMNPINQVLGLAAEAAPEAALAEVTKLKNRAAEAESKLQTLERQNQELLASQVEADLDKLALRFAPPAREKWKAALLKNRSAALELLETLESQISNLKSQMPGSAPVHNRALAKTPDRTGPGSAETPAADQRQAVVEYKNRNACSWQQAWLAVRAERPELFQS